MTSPEARPGPPRLRMAVAVFVAVAFMAGAGFMLRQANGHGATFGIVDYSPPAVAEDRAAPAFTLPKLGGSGVVSLADHTAHAVVLSFWASWCRPCREEAPDLREAWSRYETQGVRFVGVDHRDSRASAVAFVRRVGISFPSVYDPEGILANRYAVFGMPTTFVIGPDGRIAYRITGKVDGTNLNRALHRVLTPSSGPQDDRSV